jgi:DNA end-binding protein Ku
LERGIITAVVIFCRQELTVAPRAYWKGYLRLSLVSCPIALYPATSEREKISFHQLNRDTGHRIRYRKVDEDSGEEVSSDQIIKGYEVAKGDYVEITDEELASVALESTKTVEIDAFVPKSEIDELYNIRPYYIAPDGKVGEDAFAVIRDVMEQMKVVAIGRLVLTSREHIVAIAPRGKGLMGTLLRFPYEVRDAGEYFDDIPNVKLTKDMMDLAKHIVETKSGHFKPQEFEDHYEHALKELIEKKAKGEKIEAPKFEPTGKVINLMDALRRSVQAQAGGRTARTNATTAKSGTRKGRKKIEGQKEMLLPIAGKKAAREAAREEHHAQRKPARNHARQRKAG